jgi:hypothetical protein
MSAKLRGRGVQSAHHTGAARCTRLPDATSVFDTARFLAVGAARGRNRIAHTLREANAAAADICHS